ncbi:MAG: hypothetical protein ACTSSQ_04240 [Alphaproteobacteria bacterium]
MNHKHRKTLHQLFDHPINGNVNFKAIVHVLEELGAQIDHKSGNRIGVSLDGHTAAFSNQHHDLPRNEVMQMRHFLQTCEINPADYPV